MIIQLCDMHCRECVVRVMLHSKQGAFSLLQFANTGLFGPLEGGSVECRTVQSVERVEISD